MVTQRTAGHPVGQPAGRDVRSWQLGGLPTEAAEREGGGERDRTADLLIANEALSQLSYGPDRGRITPASGPPFTAGPAESRMVAKCAGALACLAAGDPLPCARPNPAPDHAFDLNIILIILDVYIWLLIAAAVLSWLIAFNVVNTRNQLVHMVGDFLWRVTEPVLRPIRSIMPNLGGIDISPVILILLIILIKDIIWRYIYPNVL